MKEQQPTIDTAHEAAHAAVTIKSEPMHPDAVHVKGYDFNTPLDLQALLKSLATTGFQATHFGQAVDEVNKMLEWDLAQEPLTQDQLDSADPKERDPAERAKTRTTIFLGATSNLISAGTRETIRYLLEHKQVACLVTTAGGIEEDLMKCLKPHYIGDFGLKGAELRKKGINRIGNLLVPNDNYCAFEDWLTPLLDEMLDEQEVSGTPWSPARMIDRLGARIDDPSSVCYWAHRNGIPIFCPAITDGSIGDMIFFHAFKRAGLVVDLVQDIVRLNRMAIDAKRTGMLICGGGLVKHHICNANLMRNGANHAVFVNTGQAFDGSDSGATPDEAVSWGKVRIDATPVKVCADATLILPLLVASTFKRHVDRCSNCDASSNL